MSPPGDGTFRPITCHFRDSVDDGKTLGLAQSKGASRPQANASKLALKAIFRATRPPIRGRILIE